MSFKIFGQVREMYSDNGISGVTVQVLDVDFFFDDLLGEVTTDSGGSFCLNYNPEDSKDLFEDKPDIYLVVKTDDGKILRTTKDNVRLDVDKEIEINIDIPQPVLVEAGLAEEEQVHWVDELGSDYLKKFNTWTWRPEYDKNDSLSAKLKADLNDSSSVLVLMKRLMEDLKGSKDNNALPFLKLAKLFELGVTPKSMNGHFCGVPVGIRTGDLDGYLAEIGNTLGFLWGFTLLDSSPWVGKGFSPISNKEAEAIGGVSPEKDCQGHIGINYFNKINLRPLNNISFQVLSVWMGLDGASETERISFGNEKSGGNFMAFTAPSVYHGSKRDVFQLNYRWKNLGNFPPFSWLVDEMVQVADGMYLGQLLFATKRLQSDYDPNTPPSDYKYQHFGYFLLFDESWNPEARRLFPHLDIPVIAPGIKKSDVSYNLPKFTNFTFQETVPQNSNDAIMEKVKADMSDKPTIMHLLKDYSDKLYGSLDNNSTYFTYLQEMFNRGIAPKTVRGFVRGALVSGHAEGLLKIGNVNTINMAWLRIGRDFSPWTGKTFEDINIEKLKDVTDGYESGELPTSWGTNTQTLRTPKERFTGKLMKLAGIPKEDATAEEAREFGYDLKNLFFIARQAKSINANHDGKTIFQFNYRWPKLETIPPDCYCIDELVQIAEGLYLGTLMYATEPLKPYEPTTAPSEYKYRLFGYFILMDEAWHQVRLDIGFDLGNV